MQLNQSFLDSAQKLRYEAFMKFASELSEADSIKALSPILESNLKYVVNNFISRFWVLFEDSQIVYEIYRNQGKLIETDFEPSAFEYGALIKKIPVNYPKAEIILNTEWANSIFNHEKITFFCILPIILNPKQKMVISISYKESSPYNEIDYRFLKLVGEILLNKISSLLLLTRIEEKNKELADSNVELDALNNRISDVNKNLEQLVDERTQELQNTNNELYTLFYRTSHDFRRPLSTLSGLIQWAETTEDKRELVDILTKCEGEIQHLYRMLDKLSSISLNEFGADEQKESLDWQLIIAQIYHKYEKELKNLAIKTKHQIVLKKIFFGNPEIIFTILDSVFENAVQYVDINKPEKLIEIKIEEKNETLEIQMEDNGQGIHPSVLPHIFEMYFRGNEKSKGNGLGLYVVQKLVKNLKGEIFLKSEESKGTKVFICLPYSD